jgi:hypothetical protein
MRVLDLIAAGGSRGLLPREGGGFRSGYQEENGIR